MTEPKIGKTNWNQEINKAMRANDAMVAVVKEMLRGRPDPLTVVALTKIMTAAYTSQGALGELERIGRNGKD